MKKLLLDIHIYLSLACAGYMVIYGVSGICFNHGIRPGNRPWGSWQSNVSLPAFDKDQSRAEAVRDSLDLTGWVPFWRHRHPTDGQHVFFLNRPSREYRIELDLTSGDVQVRETSQGVIGAIIGLHGLRNLPNSAWSQTWSLYTELSMWALLFSVGSGLWFWWLRPAYRRLGWWLLAIGSGGCLMLMIVIVA